MKRILSLLFIFVLLASLSPAQAVTLHDIRQQAKSFSEQIGISIVIPEAEKAPVLRLAQSSALPKFQELDGAYLDSLPGAYCASHNDPVWSNFGQPGMRYNLPKGQEFEWQQISPPWDFARAYPENNPFTLGEAVDFIKSHATKTMGEDAQVDLFSVSLITSGKRGRATVFGYEVLPPYGVGAYELEIRQMINGWMLMDTIHNHLDDDAFKGKRPPSLLRPVPSRIASPDAYTIALHFLEIDKVLAEDIPLCPLETVIAAYEGLKSAGHIRRMSELRLGYVLFFDPGQSDRAVAFPCWLLKCEYLRDPKWSKNASTDMSVEDSCYFKQLLVNAHNGELIGPYIIHERNATAPSWN